MNPNIARRWEEMGVSSLQGYGATETAPVVSFTRIEANRIGTVGQVIPGVEVRIAPDGEVLVRGPNIFQGYWERPDATAAVIEDGWYHTGDHGTLDADGFLTLQGRKKDMLVMSDGTKVHPDDIEKVLVTDAGVRDATVVGLEREGGDVQVHAVLILHEGADADAVIAAANARLGGHQQIRGHTIWPDEEFPRTTTLKVKKNEILTWIRAQKPDAPPPSSLSATAAAALGAVERLVGQLEGVPRDVIGPDARLSTDLGIDSLGRVELLSLIEEELGVYIDDGELEPDETVGGLQAKVDAGAGNAPEEGIYGWPLNPVMGAIRIGLLRGIVWPLTALVYRRRVRGRENLRGLRHPVLFAANHHLHNDNALILSAIPVGLLWKLSVAAAAGRHLPLAVPRLHGHPDRERVPAVAHRGGAALARPARRASRSRLRRAHLPRGRADRRRPAPGAEDRHRPRRHPRCRPGRADPPEGAPIQPLGRRDRRNGTARRRGGRLRAADGVRDRRHAGAGDRPDPRRDRGALTAWRFGGN